MSNPSPPKNGTARVADLFNRVAPVYDSEPLRFFPLSADRLVEWLRIPPGAKVLDIAAGTGAVTIAAARAVGPRGHVTAIDIAERMLERAQTRIARAGMGNVDFHLMDAQALAFQPNAFDFVLCGFGLFFLPDMTRALTDWVRVAKPGGAVAFTAFADDAFLPQADLFADRLQALGMQFDTPRFAWWRLRDANTVRALVAAAGLDEVEIHTQQMGYCLPNAEGWWEVVWNSGFRGFVERLPLDARAAFKAAHLADIERLATEAGLALSLPIHFVRGRKPGRK